MSSAFYRMLLADHGTYVGPGHWFEADRRHMRIGFGWPTADELRPASPVCPVRCVEDAPARPDDESEAGWGSGHADAARFVQRQWTRRRQRLDITTAGAKHVHHRKYHHPACAACGTQAVGVDQLRGRPAMRQPDRSIGLEPASRSTDPPPCRPPEDDRSGPARRVVTVQPGRSGGVRRPIPPRHRLEQGPVPEGPEPAVRRRVVGHQG